MKKIFYESLKKYKNLNRSSFHTPGHKGEMFKSNDLLRLDFTELPLTDSLYESSGIIKKSEENLTKLYSSKKSIFSLGGNTLCIQTMLRLAAPYGGKILCDRLVHRSVVSAMALLGIQPTWISRKMDNSTGIAGKIDIDELKHHLQTKEEYHAFYLTSPSYHGVLQDITLISKECNKYGVPVLVDNAHGSHLAFTAENLHPLNQGASLVADSAHKTLPVLTGGAWLHINNDKFMENTKNAMAIFGSTSPSYPIMASMDICISWLRRYGRKEFERLEFKVSALKKRAQNMGIFIPQEGSYDPVRITLGVWSIGYTGYEFREYLYKFKIEPEYCDKNYVVLIATPFNTKQDWNRLKKAIDSLCPKNAKNNFTERFRDIQIPKTETTVREALMSPSVKVSIENAKNKVVAEIVCPCPPGVPVVMPGEKIGSFEYEALKDYGISEILVLK